VSTDTGKVRWFSQNDNVKDQAIGEFTDLRTYILVKQGELSKGSILVYQCLFLFILHHSINP
jgi:hypothetical protein